MDFSRLLVAGVEVEALPVGGLGAGATAGREQQVAEVVVLRRRVRGEADGWLNGLHRGSRTEQHITHWGKPDRVTILDKVYHDKRLGRCVWT